MKVGKSCYIFITKTQKIFKLIYREVFIDKSRSLHINKRDKKSRSFNYAKFFLKFYLIDNWAPKPNHSITNVQNKSDCNSFPCFDKPLYIWIYILKLCNGFTIIQKFDKENNEKWLLNVYKLTIRKVRLIILYKYKVISNDKGRDKDDGSS